MDIQNANQEQLQAWEQSLTADYKTLQEKGLALDLTRGKPSTEQLSLSNSIDGILQGVYQTESGVDTRNYGGLDGIKEARALGATMMAMPLENVLAGGNSSLTLMYQAVSIALHHGLSGEGSAWNQAQTVKFLCPVPGYDRHFSVCEHLDIEMINVPMTAEGPDMDIVEQKLAADSSIKGIWCVPKYSNPTGVIYSEATVTRLAKIAKVAGANFRIFWDNAYAVHDLSDTAKPLANLYDACLKEGTEDSLLQFASTSKITLAGAGVAFMGASKTNLDNFKKALGFMTIGADKVNQLRHVKFFNDENALSAHMKKHAAIIKPRFASVLKHLSEAFGNNQLGQWESPEGGYFISFDTIPGIAKNVVKLAGEAGVKLTPAGATFPYKNDPEDRNIRIAPTVPSVEEVDAAMTIFTTCVKLASVRKLLGDA